MDDDSVQYNDMEYDGEERNDSQEEDYTQTQSTQQASQSQSQSTDAHLWGYLQPCSSALTRIDFWKIHPRYTVGRAAELNQVVLPGAKVSNQHCVIFWDGQEAGNAIVTVHDNSSNGTFINGQKIGRAQTRIITDGNEIAFGSPHPQVTAVEDYRFIFRLTANGVPTHGLYAHYDIGHELGKGSFASVRVAVSRSNGKKYAVKMIHDKASTRANGTGTRQATLTREINIMEKLKHRNICELVEVFFHENNEINLVLELVEGGDLLEYILRNEGLSERQAQHVTYQMCDALAYIHSKGVAHRDLKPENVLLTLDNPPIVKVADFGLAKVADSLTMLKTMCGTPSYLAPEVVKQVNQEGYDNRVDSWSVGVIVFSMITNSSPFIEDENRDIRHRIITRTIDWEMLERQDVSSDCFDFVQRLLQEDPVNRMSLTDALDHPWMMSYGGGLGSKSAGGSTVSLETTTSGRQLDQGTTTSGSRGGNKRVRSQLTPSPAEVTTGEAADLQKRPRRSTRRKK